MCVQMQKTITDPARMKFETNEFYLKDEAEMRALFPEYPEAADNTAKIADMCGYDFEFGKYKLPRFKLPRARATALTICKSSAAQDLRADTRTTTEPLQSSSTMSLP